MAITRNSAEGQADETVVSTSNSGAGSGTAWDAISFNGGTFKFDTAQFSHGAVAYYVLPVVSTECWVRRNFAVPDTTAMISFYVRIPSKPTATSTIAQLRHGTAATGFVQMTAPDTTIAAGSNGVNTSTFAGAGVLNVASSTAFATTGSGTGALTVATGGTPATITYTGKTSTTFTGCNTTAGGGVMSTGGAVSQPQAFRVQTVGGTTVHTTLPISLNSWYRCELRQAMGSTSSNGTTEFAYYTLASPATAVQTAYSSAATNTGVIATDTAYTNVRYGRCSSATTDVTNIWLDSIQDLTGGDASVLNVDWPATVAPTGSTRRVCTSIGPIVWE